LEEKNQLTLQLRNRSLLHASPFGHLGLIEFEQASRCAHHRRRLTWDLEGLKAFVASRHDGMAVTRPGARLIDVIPRVKRQNDADPNRSTSIDRAP
jgi:hypothetical protein